MKCRVCGKEYEGNFCPNCGQKNIISCPKCGADYTGDFCSNCGVKAIKQGKLLGFRSNKVWKKILSVMYMIFAVPFIVGLCMTITSVSDAIINAEIILFLIAPYIFMSNFKLRNVLPLFKKHRKGLSFLGMICVYAAIFIIGTAINPATYCEHKWIEAKRTQATCIEDGQIQMKCDLCDSVQYEYIDKKGHKFEIVENNEEQTVRLCSVCGEETIENKKISENQTHNNEQVITTKKEEHKHKWEKAACETPSICNECGAKKGDALGHTTDCGVCTRCHKEFRKQSPVTILDWKYNMDSVGGVEWNFKIKNNTDKQIKYVTLQWDCYNAVGDLIYNDIGWNSSVKVRVTGPIDAYETTGGKRNTEKFYNFDYNSCKMTEITVEYMDGTKESVTPYHDNAIK